MDHAGRSWTVWDVFPQRNRANLFANPVDPQPGDRGWLAFQCTETGERRRLTPVPDEWVDLSDAAVAELLAKAEVLPPRRRLIE